MFAVICLHKHAEGNADFTTYPNIRANQYASANAYGITYNIFVAYPNEYARGYNSDHHFHDKRSGNEI